MKNISVSVLVIIIAAVGWYIYAQMNPARIPTIPVTTEALCDVSGNPDLLLVSKVLPDIGRFYGDTKCQTLYTFINDKPNESTCYDACAKTWIPYQYDREFINTSASQNNQFLSLIKRSDGITQLAFRGQPLYTYSGDSKYKDYNGDGLEGNAWKILRGED
jgi:predicted lipoprotein with Yx(FWY)xxD motif